MRYTKRELVSIILINWNQLVWLKRCLSSLSKVTYPFYEIILVDNASEDGSIEYVRKNFPKIKIIQNKRNLGFGTACNRGIKSSRGKYILLLNIDTEVKPDFIDYLVQKMMEDSTIGIVQSKILLLDDPKKYDLVGSFLTPLGFIYYYGYRKKADVPAYDHSIDLFGAKGASMMIKKEVLDRIGLFDEDYFVYFEEFDLCWRAWLAGYKVVYEPRSVIYHKCWSGGGMWDRSFLLSEGYKNRINSLIKNLGSRSLFKILPLHIFSLFITGLFSIFVDYKTTLAIMRALAWNFLNINRTLRKRQVVQSAIRKVTDEKIFKHGMKNPGWRYYYCLFTGQLEQFEDICL